MLKSEMQHQYWLTKKVVQRKLGGKEDECVVSSDAELDAKIELFKSIADSCIQLHRVIDHYQERLCILAQEENNLGKFLKEAGKSSQTTGKVMTNAGKAISYCGQTRISVRAPLVRLHHEVETFRGRAVIDTKETIIGMERERTEYRAALSWMKSASAQLDPDSGKGLDKFRKAQNHVRASKAKFDRLTLDCLQKIDLLAAARCNMFSHALVAYQQALNQFFTKTTETFKTASKQLSNEPHYNFCILKELTQAEKIDPDEATADANGEGKLIDSDQMLFFQDDYKDEEKAKAGTDEINGQGLDEKIENLIDVPLSMGGGIVDRDESNQLMNELKSINFHSNDTNNMDLLGIMNAAENGNSGGGNDYGDFISAKPLSFMPSQLLLNDLTDFDMLTASAPAVDNSISNVNSNDNNGIVLDAQQQQQVAPVAAAQSKVTKSKNTILELFNKIPNSSNNNNNNVNNNGTGNTNSKDGSKSLGGGVNGGGTNKTKLDRKDMSAWFQLFAELDPLANPDAIDNKISGGNTNNSHAA